MRRTDELIKRVLELDAAATPGPWYWELDWIEDEGTQERPIGTEVFSIRSRDPNGSARTQFDKAWASGEDGALVAEYRTLAPKLADMLERAMEELEDVRQDSVQVEEPGGGGPAFSEAVLAQSLPLPGV